MAKRIVILNSGSPGADSLKGGMFFGNSLIPGGTFTNSPQTTKVEVSDDDDTKSSFTLTLGLIKEELQNKAKEFQKTNTEVLDEESINTFLQNYTQLLIDRSDLRNFVFFGSAYTELNYHINNIVKNYPYKSYVGVDYNVKRDFLKIEPLEGGKTQITFKINDVLEGKNLPFREDINFNWTSYEFVDNLGNRFPIEGVISPYNEIISVENSNVNDYSDKTTIRITTEDKHGYTSLSAVDILIVDDITKDIALAGTFKVKVINSNTFELEETYGEFFQIKQMSFGNETFIYCNEEHNFQNHDHIKFKNLQGYPELNDNEFIVYDVTYNSFKIKDLNGQNVNSSSFNSYSGNYGTVVKLTKITGLNFNSGYTRTSVAYQADIAYATNYKISFVVNGLVNANNLIESTESIQNFSIDISDIILGEETLIKLSRPHNYIDGQIITINDIVGTTQLNNNEYRVKVVDNRTINLLDISSNHINSIDFTAYDGGGRISRNNTIFNRGLIISPTIKKLTEYNIMLDPVEKAIIYNNPAPWPIEKVTKNIIGEGSEFDLWVENNNNLTKADLNDIGIIQSDFEESLNLKSALGLDETYTNELIRRAIPHRIINELNDADNAYFTRFILLAGKMFDLIKVYIDFLKYTHTINYSDFNQLSPEFYQLYAEHYGFNLVSSEFSDGIEFNLSTQDELTLKKQKEERQKNLLLNLLYLYRTKGTQSCIRYLVVAIGLPQGLVKIEEFIYEVQKDSNGFYPNNLLQNDSNFNGIKKVDNEKVFIPEVKYEIDPEYSEVKYQLDFKIKFPFDYFINRSYFQAENYPSNFISFYQDSVIPLNGQIYLGQDSSSEPFKIKLIVSDSNNNSIVLSDIKASSIFESELSITNKIVSEINSRTNIHGFSAFNNDGTINLYYPRNKNHWKLYKEGNIIIENYDNLKLKVTYNSISYKTVLDNEYDLNLRESNILIDSQNAIFKDVINKNNFSLTFGKFEHRNYANLQDINNYYLLPLTFPDKYCGIGVRYMIPKDGLFHYTKQKGKTQIDLGSLYHIGEDVEYITDNETGNQYPITLNGIKEYAKPGVKSEAIIIFDNLNDGDPFDFFVHDKFGQIHQISEQINFNNNIDDTLDLIVDSINNFIGTYEFKAERITGQKAIKVISSLLSSEFVEGRVIGVNSNGNVTIKNESIFSKVKENELYKNDKDFIIARIEENHLVVRLRLNDENGVLPIQERVAIFENLFVDDGLLHQLKLLYRPKGVEVYQDTKFLGLAKWINVMPDYSINVDYRQVIDNLNNGLYFYETIDYIWAKLPNKNNNDKARWWDLFIGNPIGINLYFESVQIFEKPSVTFNNPLLLNSDVNNNYESETYNFKFSNNSLILPNGLVDSTSFNLPVEFRTFKPNFPEQIKTNHYIDTDLENNKISNLALINKRYDTSDLSYKLGVKINNIKPDFFNIGKNIDVTEDNLFSENAWSKTLRNDFKYFKLNSGLENYYSLFSNTITYNDLLPFIESVDGRFRSLIESFIPIVVNIQYFGQLISNNSLNLTKNYYANLYKLEQPKIISNGAIGFFTIDRGFSGGNIQIKLQNANLVLAESDYLVPVYRTVESIVNQINQNFLSNQIRAEENGNQVRVFINPNWYNETYDLNVNNEKFDIILNDVFISNVFDFYGGYMNTNLNSDFEVEFVNRSAVINSDNNIYTYFSDETNNHLYVYNKAENANNFYI